jgi:hypothetical protein
LSNDSTKTSHHANRNRECESEKAAIVMLEGELCCQEEQWTKDEYQGRRRTDGAECHYVLEQAIHCVRICV